MKNNDQSKAKHGAVLENLKGKKIQKGRAMGLCTCQDKDNKQKAGNSLRRFCILLGIMKLLQVINIRYL